MTNKIIELLQNIWQYVPQHNVENKKISAGNVGWHIEHIYLTTIKIANTVLHSNPNEYTQKFNAARFIVFTTKHIPRGKAKAPKEVVSKGVSINELKDLYKKAIEKIDKLALAKNNQFFLHPYFGNLNKKQTIKMLQIHTYHHTKIIKDILQ